MVVIQMTKAFQRLCVPPTIIQSEPLIHYDNHLFRPPGRNKYRIFILEIQSCHQTSQYLAHPIQLFKRRPPTHPTSLLKWSEVSRDRKEGGLTMFLPGAHLFHQKLHFILPLPTYLSLLNNKLKHLLQTVN